LTEGSGVKLLFSIRVEEKVGIPAMQGVCRLRRFSVVKLRRIIEGLLLRAYAESKEARTVEVFAGVPQGVRAENLIEVGVIWKNIRKDRPLSH
jgi:hypothetical protein